MSGKTWVIQQLGKNELLLPTALNAALAANDRAKYFFTLLQVAKDHAVNPEDEVSNLKNERLACGIDDSSFDKIVEQAQKDQENYKIPKAKEILENITAAIKEMILPIGIASTSQLSISSDDKSYDKRLEKILQGMSAVDETLPGSLIDDITLVQRNKSDSLHLLVMDLHKELNQIQSQIAQESIDGAKVYGVTEQDRDIIKSFMAGINETAKLKFGHPGLGTTATRSGDTLVIQNDIGTTDAHVLVIHIKEKVVTLTYTDVHIQRLLFFHSLFEKFNIKWDDTRSKNTAASPDSDIFHISIGTYVANDAEDLKTYIKFLGSRIVFLIDWNRARKRLQNFMKKKDVIILLKWAADNNYGHRGFLELGGEQLIYETIEQVSKGAFHYGDSISSVIGREDAIELLKFILKTTSEGLLEGKSELLIRDEVRAETMNYLRTAFQSFLDIAISHALLVLDIATTVREGMLESHGSSSNDIFEKNAKRAQKWEKKADELVQKARHMVKIANYPKIVEELLVLSDDVADSLEEISFMMTLISPKGITERIYEPLNDLADLALQCSREYLKTVENARYVHRGNSRDEMEDFLQSIDKIITIEHRADEANRIVRIAIMREATDFKELHLFSEISKNIEDAVDTLTKLSLRIREYVLEDLMIR